MLGRMRRSTVDKAFLPNASRSRWVVPDHVHVPEKGGIGPSALQHGCGDWRSTHRLTEETSACRARPFSDLVRSLPSACRPARCVCHRSHKRRLRVNRSESVPAGRARQAPPNQSTLTASLAKRLRANLLYGCPSIMARSFRRATAQASIRIGAAEKVSAYPPMADIVRSGWTKSAALMP